MAAWVRIGTETGRGEGWLNQPADLIPLPEQTGATSPEPALPLPAA